jgi:hypothetical protein
VQHQVDDQPVEEEAQVVQGAAHLGADEAVRAVGADDVAGGQGAPLAGARDPVSLLDDDGERLVRLVLDGDDLPAALHRYRRLVLNQLVELGLEQWLDEEVGGVPAGGTHAGPVDELEVLAVGVAPGVHGVVGLDRRALVGAQAEGLEDAGDLVVEVHRPRHRIERRMPLDRGDTVAGAAQQRGQHLADGAVSGDDDVVLLVHELPQGCGTGWVWAGRACAGGRVGEGGAAGGRGWPAGSLGAVRRP